MRGRNAKSALVLALEGKTHLGSAEIDRRAAAEIKIGEVVFPRPEYISENKLALRRWKELKNYALQSGGFFRSVDVDFMARHCELWAEYRRLKKEYDKFPPECMKDCLIAMNKLSFMYKLLREDDTLMGLNPQSRIRMAVVKPEKPKEKTEMEMAGFNND